MPQGCQLMSVTQSVSLSISQSVCPAIVIDAATKNTKIQTKTPLKVAAYCLSFWPLLFWNAIMSWLIGRGLEIGQKIKQTDLHNCQRQQLQLHYCFFLPYNSNSGL